MLVLPRRIHLVGKNIIVALFLGIVTCSIVINKLGFINPILTTYASQGIGGNLDMLIYVILFGIFMATIKRAGGFAAFTNFADRQLNNSRKTKFVTFLLSGIVLNQSIGTIGIGSVMRPLSDRHRISREKLGFILSSTAEPIAALVPITIYMLFFGGLISGILPDMDGGSAFVHSIPFNFFCIISLIFTLFSVLEIIPDFGYMRKCEKRAAEGQLVREGSLPLDTRELDEMKAPEGVKPDILCFILPFVTLFITMIYYFVTTGIFVITTPCLVGLVIAILYPLIRGYITFRDLGDVIFGGAKSMVGVVIILSLAFTFGNAVGAVGFANYLVEIAGPIISPAVLPALVFLLCCVVSYVTGSLVSGAIVLAPIALTLGVSSGANLPLIIAALVGGSTFGDVSSPLSDIVVESAMGASVDVVELGKAQFPYKALMAVVSLILYLILGFVL
jgi:Na+/H+ antiporter NhaC